MANKDFQNGFVLGLASGGVEKVGIEPLNHTVTFTVDREPYEIVSIKDGQSVSTPNPNPTKEGEFLLGWFKDNTKIQFPYLPNEGDVELNAIFTTMQQIEYISSDGVNEIYIDTKIIPTDNTKIIIDYEYNKLNQWNMPFGIRYDNNVSNNLYLYSNMAGTCYVGWGNKDTAAYYDFFKKGIRTKLTLSKGELIKENISTGEIIRYSFTARDISTNKSIYVFKGNENSTLRDNYKLYGFKIYEGDELKMDLIPVKAGEGEYCAYDNVTGKFFTNSGTGKFIYNET